MSPHVPSERGKRPRRPRSVRPLFVVPGERVDVTDRDLVGNKALGLAQLASGFLVPPFLVITSECWARGRPEREWLSEIAGSEWPTLRRALLGILRDAPFGVIVRPSIPNELMSARGTTRSHEVRDVDLSALLTVIRECFATHERLKPFALIVQRLVDGRRGHLSNEFHVSRDPEEWFVELELTEFDDLRESTVDSFRVSDPLPDAGAGYHGRLRALAGAYAGMAARHHFEWVIDGEGALWVVQSDAISPTPLTAHPGQYWLDRPTTPLGELRPPLRRPGDSDRSRFPKLRPLAEFEAAGAAVTPFALLDDPTTLGELLAGRIPEQLEQALRTLIDGGPITIRVDLASEAIDKNLPKSDTVLSWSQCERFLTDDLLRDPRLRPPGSPVLLIHRFIAASTCAFAVCDPTKPEVEVHSTFGQADGLSMFPHDTAIITSSGQIRRTTRCKIKYLEARDDGSWFEQETPSDLLWVEALTNRQLLEIARITTAVARNAGTLVFVMFFGGVPPEASASGVLPWIRETGSPGAGDGALASHARGITALPIVRDLPDLRLLLDHPTPPTHARLVPHLKIVRNMQRLTDISRSAADAKIALVWEGSRLAHSWYALEHGGANILAVGERAPYTARQTNDLVFNKLVRDGIPTKIQRHGERPITARAVGDILRVLLQQKLVEEAI